MRCCAIMLAVLLLTPLALADQNPDIRVHLDFDPPDALTRIDPEPGSVFWVYIVTDCFGYGGGLGGIVLAFERTFGGVCLGCVNLLSGITVGDIEDPIEGWTAVGAECAYPDENGIVIVGYVSYFYAGPPGHIRIIRTELDGGESGDCNALSDQWCVSGNAGVGVDAPPGELGCGCGPTPAEERSWGTIKALYR